jgi:hypothetical protein
MPAHLVVYRMADGKVSSDQDVPPRPGGAREITPPAVIVEPAPALAWFGLATSPAEFGVLAGTARWLESDVQGNHGSQVSMVLRFLYPTTQFFIPGVRWDSRAHADLVYSYAALMLLSAAFSAIVCYLLGRRYSFSQGRRLGWAVCGLLFGLVGLLLMLAVQEWPAQIACPACRKPRVVTRDRCEHCGAPHALPAPDGTEIFENTAETPDAALAGLR